MRTCPCSRGRRPRSVAAILAVVLATTPSACGGGGEQIPPARQNEGPVQTYDVRGLLTQLPGGPGRELMIRHEAIADFVSASGDTVGMDAMTMGFPVSEGVTLEGFAVGDTVRFTFEVRWAGSPPLRLTELEHLPPGTPLVFRKVAEE